MKRKDFPHHQCQTRCLMRKHGVRRQLDAYRLRLSNTLAENAIRPLTVGRKTGCSPIPRAGPRPAPPSTA
ncbi:MAG TPA: hypothetical protein ENJ19_02100 [Gammaproteobacteria bacterium]|nr:hypothetical protein [Gammaproteobacteria bacterium]